MYVCTCVRVFHLSRPHWHPYTKPLEQTSRALLPARTLRSTSVLLILQKRTIIIATRLGPTASARCSAIAPGFVATFWHAFPIVPTQNRSWRWLTITHEIFTSICDRIASFVRRLSALSASCHSGGSTALINLEVVCRTTFVVGTKE